jgi:hypothetical protein
VSRTTEVFTLAERPDLEAGLRSLPGTFAEFMHHDALVNRYWGSLFTDFAGFQIAVCDDGGGILAAGHSIPVSWDGTTEGLPAGLDGVLERGWKILGGVVLRRWSRRCWRWCRPYTGGAGSAAWF